MKYILSSLEDKAKKSQDRNILTHTKFMYDEELSLCLNYLKKTQYEYEVVETHNMAERKIIIFKPSYETSYLPFKVLSIKCKAQLSHRDVLGSIMGLNIKREYIGDILFNGEETITVFVLESIADFIKLNLDKISRYTASVEILDSFDDSNIKQDFKVLKDTVKSLRLDSLVSSGFLVSRTKAQEYIRSGKVFLNNSECLKSDFKVEQGDKVTIRGAGKIILDDVLGMSKKERIFIQIKKFV